MSVRLLPFYICPQRVVVPTAHYIFSQQHALNLACPLTSRDNTKWVWSQEIVWKLFLSLWFGYFTNFIENFHKLANIFGLGGVSHLSLRYFRMRKIPSLCQWRPKILKQILNLPSELAALKYFHHCVLNIRVRHKLMDYT